MVSTTIGQQVNLVTLDQDEFGEIVTREGLNVLESGDGYYYASRKSKDGWILLRTNGPRVHWVYSGRRVATQGNAAGGLMIVDITLATSQIARLVSLYVRNAVINNDLWVAVYDEDNAIVSKWAYVATGANNELYMPSLGTAATASANYTETNGFLIPPGCKLSIFQTTASAQTATLTVAIVLEIWGPATESDHPVTPTWDKSRSTNPADVTLAASTISTANTWQRVIF